jgi:hypothetical protein
MSSSSVSTLTSIPKPSGLPQRESLHVPGDQAAELVRSVLLEPGIPRNWIISPKGTFYWEQVGFDPAPGWGDRMVAKLDEVLKQK